MDQQQNKCEACEEASMVRLEAKRLDTGETKIVYVCKDHMLDPGPLLDW